MVDTAALGKCQEACVLLLELGDASRSKKRGGKVGDVKRGDRVTYISMVSNSSRLRCLLRKAAARFLTSLASRLLKPVTSGGTKSLLDTRSAVARFLQTLGVGLADRLEPDDARAAATVG